MTDLIEKLPRQFALSLNMSIKMKEIEISFSNDLRVLVVAQLQFNLLTIKHI